MEESLSKRVTGLLDHGISLCQDFIAENTQAQSMFVQQEQLQKKRFAKEDKDRDREIAILTNNIKDVEEKYVKSVQDKENLEKRAARVFTEDERGKPTPLQIIQAERFCEEQETFLLQNEISDVLRARRKSSIPDGINLADLPDYLVGLATPRQLNEQPYPKDDTIAFTAGQQRSHDSEED